MPAFELRLFGGFELRDADGATVTVSSKKGQCLLTYLALAEGRESPARVAGDIALG